MKETAATHHAKQQLLVFQSPTSPRPAHRHGVCLLLTFFSFFTIASLLTFLTATMPFFSVRPTSAPPSLVPLPAAIFDALVHYALQSNSTHMSDGDLLSLATTLRLRSPCNLLVFGLTHDSLLLRSLNHGGRSVFLDENEYHISLLEQRYPSVHLEAYDVSYTTKVRDLHYLIQTSRVLRATDCRPVQNLLYSDCKLGINDLPNELYDVGWDVIVVDGPKGYDAESPGRVAAVFTAAVMARSGGGGERKKKVDVFVHEYGREVERVSSEEFLCAENMVNQSKQLAHFVIENGKEEGFMEFCGR